MFRIQLTIRKFGAHYETCAVCKNSIHVFIYNSMINGEVFQQIDEL